MATELQLDIAAKLKELNSQSAVVILGYNKGTVSKVAKKLKGGWKPEEEEKTLESGNSETEKPAAQRSASAVQTREFKEASYIRIAPKEFRMTSRVFWDAYEAVVNHWDGWKDMSPADFLDKYLEVTLLQRGIYIGGYVVLNQEPQKEESDANV